jgi:hypothetical protein
LTQKYAKYAWDHPIPEEEVQPFYDWVEKMPEIDKLSVRRWYEIAELGEIESIQLHVFCDASKIGYGACAYLRYCDKLGRIATALVLGKARVTPLKLVNGERIQGSIPRQELTSAVVAADVGHFLTKELEVKLTSRTFWTDATCNLNRFKNDDLHHQKFEKNRIARVLKVTKAGEWRHVPTDINPADLASRGFLPDDEESWKKWRDGAFLDRPESEWPTREDVSSHPVNCLCVRCLCQR